MIHRPGTVPLSDLRNAPLVPYYTPDRVCARGEFVIRDAWVAPTMARDHSGRVIVYVVDFLAGDDDAAAQFALQWSGLREKIAELVVRGGASVGPCLLVARPLHENLNVWCFVGVEEDGSYFDSLAGMPEPDSWSQESRVV